MPKRLSKKRETNDPNTAAFRMVQRISEDIEAPPRPANVVPLAGRRRKNPAAVALGRKGGMKSAEARMEKIDPETRQQIARHAATARWAKSKGGG